MACWCLNSLIASLCLSLNNWNKLTQGLSPSGMIWPALTLKPARWDSSFHPVYIPTHWSVPSFNIFNSAGALGKDNKTQNIYVILAFHCPGQLELNRWPCQSVINCFIVNIDHTRIKCTKQSTKSTSDCNANTCITRKDCLANIDVKKNEN